MKRGSSTTNGEENCNKRICCDGEISNQVNAMTPHHRAVISTFLVSLQTFQLLE